MLGGRPACLIAPWNTTSRPGRGLATNSASPFWLKKERLATPFRIPFGADVPQRGEFFGLWQAIGVGKQHVAKRRVVAVRAVHVPDRAGSIVGKGSERRVVNRHAPRRIERDVDDPMAVLTGVGSRRFAAGKPAVVESVRHLFQFDGWKQVVVDADFAVIDARAAGCRWRSFIHGRHILATIGAQPSTGHSRRFIASGPGWRGTTGSRPISRRSRPVCRRADCVGRARHCCRN